MEYKIAVLPGDGIGEEVIEQALKVLDYVANKSNVKFHYQHALIGGAAWDKYGRHFPDETKKLCEDSQAILFGSVGGSVKEQHLDKWKNCEKESILGLRKTFNFYANFRPVRVFPALLEISPLKPQILKEGIDILFVRELVGDIYFGEHKTYLEDGERRAIDVANYTEAQIKAIAKVAFEAARKRKNKVTSVDKANVLDISKLWRLVVKEVSKDYPDVVLEDMLVDNCAMQLVLNPSQFDVILTSNMFGDILSDIGAVLPGSLGLMPSASFGLNDFAMYEPIGGSAPDIKGQGIANPIAQILSTALMLRYSFKMENEAKTIELAVEKTLAAGNRTKDISTLSANILDTQEMTDNIIKNLG